MRFHFGVFTVEILFDFVFISAGGHNHYAVFKYFFAFFDLDGGLIIADKTFNLIDLGAGGNRN